MRAKLILILLITILGVHTGFAQFSRPLSVGAGAGVYFGDAGAGISESLGQLFR